MKINRIFLVFLFLAVFFSVASVYATTYYVAKNGNDSNLGTEAQPWLTIQKAADTVQAGDTVYIKAGTYNERVVLTTSGSASSGYITFQNYENDEVIMTGTNLGSGIMINGLNVSYVKIIGFKITDFHYGGIQFWLNGANDDGYIEIRNCEVSYQYFLDGDLAFFGRAILVNNLNETNDAVSNIVVDNNYLHNNITYQGAGGEVLTLKGNIDGFKVTNNHLSNNSNIGIDILGTPARGYPHNGLVKGNITHAHNNSNSANIYVDGASYNLVIEDNISYASDGLGFSIANEIHGSGQGPNQHIIFRRNIAYNNWTAGMVIGGYDEARGRTNNCVFVHNAFYNNGNAEVDLDWGSNNLLKNNIFCKDNNPKIVHQQVDSGTFYFDYNCHYPCETTTWKWKGSILTSFADWQSASGADNSFCQDPLFVDPNNADFHLQSNSPCIDRGGFLTKTTSSGSGKTLVVNDARYFTDGYGVIEGDLIQIGSNDPLRVVSVNYNTNTITVDKSISWNAGDGVSYPYSGSAPDIGAYEYETCSEKGGTCCSQEQECQGGSFVSSSDCGNLCCVGGICTTPTIEQITALKTTSPININGKLNELAWSFDNYVTFSNPSRSDNQVKVLTLWDSDNLYLAYEVTDSQLEAVETTRDVSFWRDDGVEFYLDTLNDKVMAMQTDDYHFIVNINDVVADFRGTGTGEDVTWNSNIVSKTKTDTNGYTTEIKIPWSDLNVNPLANQVIGLLLANNDRDNGVSSQFDWLNLIETGPYARPNLWGELLLSGETTPELAVPTVIDIKFTEVGQSQEITSIKKDKWYDLYIYVDDPQGFQDISFADLWLNSPSYTEGTIDNRGGNHYAASSYIWLYSISIGSIYAKEIEGKADWTRITGILGLYTDDDSGEFEINSQEGWAKARVKLLYDAEVGSWTINGYVRDKEGNKSSLYSETVSVTSEPPGADLDEGES